MDEQKMEAVREIEVAIDRIEQCINQKREPGWSYRNTITTNRNIIREQCARLRAALKVQLPALPSDDECDKAAAQAMDRVAAAKNLHALEINPDVTAHHTLRRELIRAGYALALCGNDAETDAEMNEKRR